MVQGAALKFTVIILEIKVDARELETFSFGGRAGIGAMGPLRETQVPRKPWGPAGL